MSRQIRRFKKCQPRPANSTGAAPSLDDPTSIVVVGSAKEIQMSESSNRIVLVTGGTGKQGGATIRHLLASRRVRVRALTRSPHSEKAKRLAAQGVELASGDFDAPQALAAALSGVSAAFSVQGDGALEVQRGKCSPMQLRQRALHTLCIPHWTVQNGGAECRTTKASGASSSTSANSRNR